MSISDEHRTQTHEQDKGNNVICLFILECGPGRANGSRKTEVLCVFRKLRNAMQ